MRKSALLVTAALLSASSIVVAQTTTTTVITTVPGGSTQTASTVPSGSAAALAQAQAQQAQVGIANSTFAPGVSSGAGALTAGGGTLEMNVLTAVSLNAAARRIAEAVNLARSTEAASKEKPLKNEDLLVIAGTVIPDTSAAPLYDLRLRALKSQLARDSKALGAAIALKAPIANPAIGAAALIGNPVSKATGAVGVADATQLVTKGLSYLSEDVSAGGAPVTIDGYTLSIAITGHIPNAVVPSLVSTTAEVDAIAQQATELMSAADTANELLTKADAAIAATDPKAEGFPAKRAAAVKAAQASVASDVSSISAFLSTLTSSGGGSLTSVAQAKVLRGIITRGGVLYVNVVAGAGGTLTKKSLVSSLGILPIHAAGGVVVNYAYVPKAANSPAVANVFSELTSYHNINQAKRAAVYDRTGGCVNPTKDASKYCAWADTEDTAPNTSLRSTAH